ncbi:MAG: DUF1592 domain-containing protein [Planctomycetota bacterium]
MATGALLGQKPQPFGAPQPPEHVVDFVEGNCFDCHGDGSDKGGLDLEAAPKRVEDRLWRWSRMRDRVGSHEMPPLEESEVTTAEREQFVAWVDSMLEREVAKLPGKTRRSTIRRLSREHWCNSVQDLFGVAVAASAVDRLPVDDLGYGFDTIGDALTLSTLHVEKYLGVAELVAEQVFHGEDPDAPERRIFGAAKIRGDDSRRTRRRDDYWAVISNATLAVDVELPRTGRYRLRIAARGNQAGDEPARMLLGCDGASLHRFDVANREVRDFEHEVEFAGGLRRLELSFVNDFYDPKNPDRKRRDRNLLVHRLEVIGPIDRRAEPAQQAWLRAPAGKAAEDRLQLTTLVARLASRLWRQQAPAAAQQRLLAASLERLDAGEDLVSAQRFALTAALVSPWFLFRREAGSAGLARATRLAYFLWASAPDERLLAFAAAADSASRDASGDASGDAARWLAELDRMLIDPRSQRLATDFAAQWLELRSLAELTPDPDRFVGFDQELRRSLRGETERLFLAVLREQRDVRELLDCDFTFVDNRLARFYGVDPNVLPAKRDEDGFARLRWRGAQRRRGGLLGHASVLALTSDPTRTSPVRRGKWLLDNLLGQAPPPPPPGNDSFTNEDAIDDTQSMREQMAAHRSRSKCAVCHVRMDALGLAMERFDAIGRFRMRDGNGDGVIDASSELPDGRRLDGLADLKRVLAEDPAFVRALAKKLFVYAVGRDLDPADHLRIDRAVRAAMATPRVTLRDLVVMVASDPAFAFGGDAR